MAVAIWWLGRDFRLADNPALAAAARYGAVLPVVVLDAATRAQGAASRWRLGRAIRALDAELQRRHGRGLLLLSGAPEALLPRLATATGATAIHRCDWPCPQGRAAQDRLGAALDNGPARLQLHPGHLLAHPGAVRTGKGGAYRVFTPFARALRAHGPDRPLPEPALRLAAPPGPGLDPQALDLAPDLCGGGAVLDSHALPAGEAAAMARLRDFLNRARDYAGDRDRPDRDACSGLSEALAVGEISPRQAWAEAAQHLHGPAAEGAGKFLSELSWREFAWHLLIDFPQLAERPWRPEWRDFPWQTRGPGLTAWQQGRSGVALVDAGLREMRVTGRMHNRIRMVVASWLTKNLLIDWRVGLAHFADSLTDWDPASNAMNWQWVAGCGPDAAPFFRIFSPERQAARFDPQAGYRRRWLLGYEGANGADARDYFATIPPGWQVPRRWQAGGDGGGRQRALDAYAGFRASDPAAG